MKNTGIVRRIDDLGRVVIPKDIRRELGIREGDPLEIYREGTMVGFRKYYPNEQFTERLAEIEDKITDYYAGGFNKELAVIRMAFDEIGHQLRAIEEAEFGEG
jgi:transcriptional pleiotropic regulator of transition state genes